MPVFDRTMLEVVSSKEMQLSDSLCCTHVQ